MAIGVGALLAMPAMSSAQTPTPPPYDIPSGDTSATLPLVAALTLPRGQTLGQVLRQGLRVRLTAYRPIHVAIDGSLPPRFAKRLHVRAKEAIPRRTYTFDKPGVYTLRLRVAHRVATKLRNRMVAKFLLRTALRGQAGNNSTSSVSPVTVRR